MRNEVSCVGSLERIRKNHEKYTKNLSVCKLISIHALDSNAEQRTWPGIFCRNSGQKLQSQCQKHKTYRVPTFAAAGS